MPARQWFTPAFLAFALLLQSTFGFALEIELKQNMYVRLPKSNGFMRWSGRLLKGSVVRVADDRVVWNEDNSVNLQATLDAMAGGKESKEDGRPFYAGASYGGGRTEDFAPITIVKVAEGSSTQLVAGAQYYMALKFLHRRGNAATVVQDGDVFKPIAERSTDCVRSSQVADQVQYIVWPVAEAAAPPEPSSDAAPAAEQKPSEATASAPEPPSARSASENYQTQSRLPEFPLRGACADYIHKIDRKGQYKGEPPGRYGKNGLAVLRELGNDPVFMNAGDYVKDACPSFSLLSEEQRRDFWVWTFGILAYPESTCKPGARNEDPANEDAVAAAGLYQMEENSETRRGREKTLGRPGVCTAYNDGVTSTTNIYSVELNTQCAVAIMRNQFLNMKLSIFNRQTNYWAPFKNRQVGSVLTRERVRSYPGCRKGQR